MLGQLVIFSRCILDFVDVGNPNYLFITINHSSYYGNDSDIQSQL
jgi:hypothetical protein